MRAALICLLLLMSLPLRAEELRVAVAANFASALRDIAAEFERASGHSVKLAIGSTGKHYAQIRHGAPFDAFFAADAARPAKLESEGKIIAGSRFTYALGRLALWSPRGGLADADGAVLSRGEFEHLAIANPRLAPYGFAARELLEQRGLWDSIQPKLVRGENIGQAYRFVRSGAAELGLVAFSQLRQPDAPAGGSYWLVPAELHSPIEQQAVQLTDKLAAAELLEFVRSETARDILSRYGYGLPR
jgi:molybdate transport system substrate-binding protein